MDNPSYSMKDSTALIYFSSKSNPSAVKMNQITLDDGHNLAGGRLWITSVSQLKDFEMKLNYSGEGKLLIKSVVLTEQIRYRYVRIIIFLLASCVLNSIYLALWAKGIELQCDRWNTVLGLALITVLASMPLFADFIFLGHDMDFHMQRIAAVAEELENHQFPVRIMTGMLNGYGYVNSLFYCDIFLYLPAVLYNLMLPLRTCYQIYVILINSATSIIGYYVFAKMTHSRQLGVIGSAVYTLSSYRLVNVYVRAAAGEYTAMCFFPLVVYGLWKIYSEDKVTWKEWFPLSAAMTGIIHCHVLSVEITMLFVLVFSLINIRKTIKKWRALMKAALVTMGLSAWYIIPFLDSMSSMPIKVSGLLNKIQSTGTYPIQLFGLFIHGSGSSVKGGMRNEMPLSLGITLVLGIVVAMYVCLHRQQWKLEDKPLYRLLRKSFIFASAAMVMTLKYVPYDETETILGEKAAKIIGAVQFSWRYLAIATALLSVTVIIALAILRDFCIRTYKAAVIILMCSQLLFIGIFYWQYAHSASEYSFDSNDNRSQSMYIGTGEYLLKDTDKAKLAVARCEAISGAVEVYNYDKVEGIARITCKNTGNTEAEILLPIFHYNNYHVYDAGTGEEYPIETGDNNRMQITVGVGYNGTLEVVYEAPLLWRGAEAVSILIMVFLLVVVVKELKHSAVYNKTGNVYSRLEV